MLLVEAWLDARSRATAQLDADEEGYPTARVIRTALSAASLVGDVACSRRLFQHLEQKSTIDGQAFGLLIAAHGQVSCFSWARNAVV